MKCHSISFNSLTPLQFTSHRNSNFKFKYKWAFSYFNFWFYYTQKMVLVLNGVLQEECPLDTGSLFMQHPVYRDTANQLLSIPTKAVSFHKTTKFYTKFNSIQKFQLHSDRTSWTFICFTTWNGLCCSTW